MLEQTSPQVNQGYQIATIFRACEHLDKTEGRGGIKVLGYTFDGRSASTLAKGKGVWDGDGPVDEKLAILLPGGKAYLLAEKDPVKVYKDATECLADQALSGLTPDQRAALRVILQEQDEQPS
jgi:hypothetical protein